MPWWSISLSSSSSSSSSNSQHHPRQSDFLLNSPACHRDRKINLVRSSSVPLPQPLPLPKISALFSGADKLVKEISKPVADNLVKEKPKPIANKLVKDKSRPISDKEKSRPIDSSWVTRRDGGLSVDARRQGIDAQTGTKRQQSIQRSGTWSSRNIAHQNINVDILLRSAPDPPSANSSPMLSSKRVLNDDPCSEPAMPMPLGFPCSAFTESTMVSRDSSPIHSPQEKSKPPPYDDTNRRPASPKDPKLSIETSSTHQDNSNIPINVHPLPLPPALASSAQTYPVSQRSTRPEFFPIKSHWIKGKLIGRGTFGSVYVATNRETGALCAMKEVELLPDDPNSAERMTQLEQEIKVLSHLNHPNIVQYYGSEIVDDKFNIYLEYVYPGSITKYISEHCGAITEAVVRNFTRHILSGLAYLHERKTIHRDIKGANLLVDASGVVKLADFGMAKHLTGQAADLSLKGSPYWMAPELMQAVMQRDNSSEVAFAIDIWSLGCTVIEMLTGKPPWSGYEGAAAMLKVLRESPPIPDTLSPEGKDFLRCCFRRKPADRPPASKLLDHPFLKSSQQVPSSCQESILKCNWGQLNTR